MNTIRCKLYMNPPNRCFCGQCRRWWFYKSEWECPEAYDELRVWALLELDVQK